MRSPALPMLPVVALLLSACGGGGGGDAAPAVTAPEPVTATVLSTAFLDGSVNSFGGVDDGGALQVGDLVFAMGPTTVRGFLSFDLADIPPGVQVSSANLTVSQFVTNGDPFGTLGVVLVDAIDYGTQLDATAYDAVSPNPAFAVLSSTYLAGEKTTSVTEAVQACISAGAPRCQFRLRFAVDVGADMTSDYVLFHAWETSPTPAQAPRLEITYLPR